MPCVERTALAPLGAWDQLQILLLTYKALNGHAPEYLAALISAYVILQPLRSEDEYLIKSPKWRFETFGKRDFANPPPYLLTLSTPGLKLRILKNIGVVAIYFETDMNSNIAEIRPSITTDLNCRIVLKCCTGHCNVPALISTTFQNDLGK